MKQLRCHKCGVDLAGTGWDGETGWCIPCWNMKQSASYLGKKGGASSSPAKAKASRDNGYLGGRPITPKSCWEKFLAFENSVRFLDKVATDPNERDSLLNLMSLCEKARMEFIILEEDHAYKLK